MAPAGTDRLSTNGCFDVLHAGHLDALTRAAALGDVLVVLLNSDDSVRRAKGPTRPINLSHDRTALLQALGPVDHVCVFEQDDPCAALAELRLMCTARGRSMRPAFRNRKW